MKCAQRDELWREFNKALNEFQSQVEALLRPNADPARQLAEVKASKMKYSDSRAAWENHLREHRCDGYGSD